MTNDVCQDQSPFFEFINQFNVRFFCRDSNSQTSIKSRESQQLRKKKQTITKQRGDSPPDLLESQVSFGGDNF